MEAIAIGNGTGSREAAAFVRTSDPGVTTAVVSEAGASVYSASEVAVREFPELDVTLRGAISIGRRLLSGLICCIRLSSREVWIGLPFLIKPVLRGYRISPCLRCGECWIRLTLLELLQGSTSVICLFRDLP